MTPSKTVLIFVIVFVWIAVLLNLFTLIAFSYSEIIAYCFIFLGVSIYYPSHIRHLGKGVFWGSAIFLTGIIFFSDSYFELRNGYVLILPALLFVCSFSFLLTFLFNTKKIKLLAASIIILVLAVFFLFYSGTPAMKSFLAALVSLAGKYWIVLLLSVITIGILSLENKSD